MSLDSLLAGKERQFVVPGDNTANQDKSTPTFII